jgi:polyphosphate kinase
VGAGGSIVGNGVVRDGRHEGAFPSDRTGLGFVRRLLTPRGRRAATERATTGDALQRPDLDVADERLPVFAPGHVPDGGAERRQHTVDILPWHVPPTTTGPVRHLNRELSWLQFNERVLAIAEDPSLPLLERVKFVAIFTSNLDEFFQVRVAGLREQAAADATGANADGLAPSEQLSAIDDIVRQLTRRQAELVQQSLFPDLEREGIVLVTADRISPTEREHLDRCFEELIFPVLTPLAVDPAHPFPYISNLSLNLAVRLRDAGGQERFARVKIPPVLPRLMVLPGPPGSTRFVTLESVVADRLERLFPGIDVLSHHAFRVTRNSDFQVEESEAEDLLLAIQSELSRRRFGRAVRLEVEPEISPEVLDLLIREIDVHDDDVHFLPPPLGLSGLMQLTEIDRPDLRLPSFVPLTAPELTAPATARDPGATSMGSAIHVDVDIFKVLRERDVLVHHPYDAFTTSVQAFVEQAARDPKVLAIKITLYRTSGPDSPIIRALLDAAAAGKQVVALIELKARFDEEANIVWAQALEDAGVHVAYGVVGLKTHTKIALVVRREGSTVRRYVHVGTGNYNDLTARLYEDLGLLTSDPELGADLSDLFNVLTGYAQHPTYRRLVVAPNGFRRRIEELIAQETEREDGHVTIKVNALVDPDLIDALYRASQSGTTVELFVRGICCLRPGVPGLSENITVRSVVGRYLEHSRIYRFGTPERGLVHLIGSGDLMPRNLDRRVEALTPVSDPALCSRIEEILEIARRDDLLAWELGPDTVWRRVTPVVGIDTHATLQARARRRAERGVLPA